MNLDTSEPLAEGATQAEVATAFGISQRSISNYERRAIRRLWQE